MNKDNKLMMEAMHGRPQQIIISELNKVHTILNQLSTLIDLNRSEETDQLLSKIRDTAEMLMIDTNAKGGGIIKGGSWSQGPHTYEDENQ
jgi:hypothetical protein